MLLLIISYEVSIEETVVMSLCLGGLNNIHRLELGFNLLHIKTFYTGYKPRYTIYIQNFIYMKNIV